VFTGAIAYADDLVLLAPSQNAMRNMLRVCEAYAGDYDMLFNASKSKCVVCSRRVVLSHADYTPLHSFITVAIALML